MPALGAVFSLRYWTPDHHPQNVRRLGLAFGLLAATMAAVTIARDGVLFLLAWEVMALSAWLAAATEEDDPQVRRAGWIFLVAAHAGVLLLFALFTLWRHATGSFDLEPVANIPASTATALFLLAVAGFGSKAGLMPLHVWLPGAHANAPSHVSAVMSGVMLNIGVYGIVRVTGLLPAGPVWWGGALLAAGCVSAVVGIAYAIGQRDIKRLLAYSSIENMGIVVMGLGLALLGRSLQRPDWVLLGLGAALLHMANHSLFKSLLFLIAGAVTHATDTRQIDRLGGLARPMPRVTTLFVIGAVAICALPPLNGFAGEWLLYLGLFSTLGGPAAQPLAAVAAVALALTGALALACFVQLLGTVFLGTPRRLRARRACDPPAAMFVPMALLAGGCIVLGLLPQAASTWLERAAQAWSGVPRVLCLADLAPLAWTGGLGAVLYLLAALAATSLRLLPRARRARAALTWDCGYAQPTARMQYTASSFGRSLGGMFSFLVWPRLRWPVVGGVFAAPSRFHSSLPDVVLDRWLLPVIHAASRAVPRVRLFQGGRTQMYLLYVVAVVLALLVWGALGS